MYFCEKGEAIKLKILKALLKTDLFLILKTFPEQETNG